VQWKVIYKDKLSKFLFIFAWAIFNIETFMSLLLF